MLERKINLARDVCGSMRTTRHYKLGKNQRTGSIECEKRPQGFPK